MKRGTSHYDIISSLYQWVLSIFCYVTNLLTLLCTIKVPIFLFKEETPHLLGLWKLYLKKIALLLITRGI